MTKIRSYKISPGFSLIELMIALFLSGILFSISAQSLFESTAINRHAQEINLMDEAATIAKYYLERDIKRSGYFYTLKKPEAIQGTLKSKIFDYRCDSGSEHFTQSFDVPIFGINNSQHNFECLEKYKPETDVLAIRYIQQVSKVKSQYSAKDKFYIRISPNQAKLFRAKDRNHISNQIIGEYSEIFEQKSYIYYLRDTGRRCQGTKIYGLYREYNTDKNKMLAQEIVAGVEQLQIRYLVDQQWLNSDLVSDWELVDALSVSLLVRSDCPNAKAADTRRFILEDFEFLPEDPFPFQRQKYQFYVSLRN